MINKAAKTYNEIIIKKKCYDLLKYIYLTDDELNKICINQLLELVYAICN